MGSLLKRMQGVREATESDFQESGISQDELHSILRKVDSISSQNRIQIGAETFKLKALRKGYVFPLLINIVSLLVLVFGLLISWFFFQQQEAELSRPVTALESTEGLLLEMFREESALALNEKEQEISRIHKELIRIEQERDSILQDINSRIEQRERELRIALEEELEQERQKLRAEGLSEAVIEERIREIEAAKTRELNQALAAFKEEAERERAEMEAGLVELEDQYRQDLLQANSALDTLREEARQREAELQAELEAAQQVSAQEVREAQQQLALLASAREREETLSAQLLGFYTRIERLMQDGDKEAVYTALENLERFISSSPVQTVDALVQRKAADEFFIRSIYALLESETVEVRPVVDEAALQQREEQYTQELHEQDERHSQEILALQEAYEIELDVLTSIQEEEMANALLALQSEHEETLTEWQQEFAMQQDAAFSELSQRLQSSLQQNTRFEQDIKRLEEQTLELTDRASEAVRLENQLEVAQGQIQRLNTRLQDFEEEIRMLNRELSIGQAENEVLSRETRQLIVQLEDLANEYSTMTEAYQRYQQSLGGDLLAKKAALDRFFASPAVNTAFPGIFNEVQEFDQAFEQAGQEAVLFEVADETYRIYSYPTKDARLNYIQQRLQEDTREAMQEYYENMLLLLSEN